MSELRATRLKLKCLEMVEGTELRWKEVVRFKDTKAPIYRELVDYEESSLEFALGIIDGKPIWNPPKPKTVMVELSVEDAQYWTKPFNSMPISGVYQSMFNLEEACKKALGEVNGTT